VRVGPANRVIREERQRLVGTAVVAQPFTTIAADSTWSNTIHLGSSTRRSWSIKGFVACDDGVAAGAGRRRRGHCDRQGLGRLPAAKPRC